MARRRRHDEQTRKAAEVFLPPEPFWHFLLASRALAGTLVLAVAVLWGWFSWGAAGDDRRFEGQPQADGVVLGTERRTTGGKGASLLYARYRFETAEGQTIDGEDVVGAGDQEALARTGRARIQYVPEDPRQNRLFFPYMTAATAARANWAEAGITTLLLAVGAWLFLTGWRRAARAWVQAQKALRPGEPGDETS